MASVVKKRVSRFSPGLVELDPVLNGTLSRSWLEKYVCTYASASM